MVQRTILSSTYKKRELLKFQRLTQLPWEGLKGRCSCNG